MPKRATQVVRLVVVGLAGSGKTHFINTVSQYTEWQSTPGKSWYFGRVRVDQSLVLHFLEPPIAPLFDFMWLREVVSRIRATGYIVLVDSSRPHTFPEFISVLYTVRGYHPGVPVVVAANKQDSPRAWPARDIQLGLGISHVPVLPCVATERHYVRDVVIHLLQKVLHDGD